ncbi:MAG: hypothetical protein ACFFDN_49950, partial [Candidatus Hodarchaeota archaeon]
LLSNIKEIFEENKNYNNIKKSLINWALESDVKIKNKFAVEFFIEVWEIISTRYKLDQTYCKNFEKFSTFEQMIYSANSQLDKKFYRDHLNHNIRSSLLAVFIASKLTNSLGINIKLVSFLAGLFHDISIPLLSYNNIVDSFQRAFSHYDFIEYSRIPIPVNKKLMQEIITLTIIIASTPLDKNNKNFVNLCIWNQLKKNLENVDKDLLYEEMVCTIYDNHAIYSASIILSCFII